MKKRESLGMDYRKRVEYLPSIQSVIPAALPPVLPVVLALRVNGTLPVDVFLTVAVLSLGLTRPLLAAMSFAEPPCLAAHNQRRDTQ